MKAVARVTAGPVVWVAGLLLNLPLMGVMGILALLRETPRFWTNAGGYPIWLRSWVLVGYPLFFGLELLFLSWMTVASLRVKCVRDAGLRLGMGLLLLQWMWTAAVLVFLIWDNVENLIEGRPWHWAPL